MVLGNIWGTIGEEKFKSITTIYYKEAVGAILVYDITRRSSFSDICKQWMNKLKTNCEVELVTMLVENKCDLENERQVKTEEAKEFAKEHSTFFRLPLDMYFIETSAKESTNVQKAFTQVFNEIFDKNARA